MLQIADERDRDRLVELHDEIGVLGHAGNAVKVAREGSGDHVADAEALQRVDHLADDLFLGHGSRWGPLG